MAMTLVEINYLEKQLFQVAPLPLYDGGASYPDGFDIQIHSTFGKTNHLRITPEQLQKIERILLGDV
jgi:hypothetical protein